MDEIMSKIKNKNNGSNGKHEDMIFYEEIIIYNKLNYRWGLASLGWQKSIIVREQSTLLIGGSAENDIPVTTSASCDSEMCSEHYAWATVAEPTHEIIQFPLSLPLHLIKSY